MTVFGNNTTNFQITGTDIGNQVPLNNAIQRDYLIDVYPSLASVFKQSGLWVWGTGDAIGDNTTTNKSSPVQTVATGADWKQVSVNSQGPIEYFMSAIKTDGRLWMWGRNSTGQLGDNTATAKSSPVQTVSTGTNWRVVSCGGYHTAAIKTDGTLWTWGNSTNGQLGQNTTTNRSSPVQTVSTGTNWALISAGSYYCASIKTDGTLWTWGSNLNGQLGDNTRVHRSSPVQTVSTGTNWALISAGSYHCAAIKTDGRLWTWGSNLNGQLGDNTATAKSSPVQTVSTGTDWKQVAGGLDHSCAIKTDGRLWTWGNSTNGQLGQNTTTNRSSPVQTVSTGTDWKQVSAGAGTTAAIKTDGRLWLWGVGSRGQLGDNTATAKSSPVQTIASDTNWKQVSSGFLATSCIRDTSSDLFGYPL